MTKLETHRCDICGSIFYIPESSLSKLIIIENDNETLNYELCFTCKEAILKEIILWKQDKNRLR